MSTTSRIARLSLVSSLVAVLATAAAPQRAPAADVAAAPPESLFAAGRFDAAERAYAPLLAGAKDDTLVAVRSAALRLLRDDRAGAREILEPLLRRHPGLRSATSLLAEAYARDLDFAHAAPLERALGREARARQMESFAGATPYRFEGPSRTVVKFVQTDPLPLIEVRIDGRGPYLFLIDTGGADLIVDPVLADSLGCPTFGDEQGTFGGGRRRAVGLSRVKSLGLGDATFHDVPVGLLDCSRFSGVAMGRRVWGVVGTLVLMRCRATLDYPAGELVLEPRGGERREVAADTSRITIPFRLAGDHYMVARGRLDEGPEAQWFVDTGLAGAAVTAPVSALVEAGITVPDTSSGPSGIGGGGSMKVQVFPVARFRLGDAEAGGLLGVFGPFPATLERAFGFRIAGIISHAFFRPWRVTFDFDAMRLILAKPATGG
jgi:hypothetical protein